MWKIYSALHSGTENLKKSRPKKLVKSNKLILRKIFLTKYLFCNFKNGQKAIFLTGKTAKNATSRKKNDLLDFTSFFAWTYKDRKFKKVLLWNSTLQCKNTSHKNKYGCYWVYLYFISSEGLSKKINKQKCS